MINFSLFFLFLFGLIFWESPVFSIPPEIWKKVVVEDFESLPSSEILWKKNNEPDLESPEYQITENIVAPIPNSRRSLLLRFTSYTNYPSEFRFQNPKRLDGFLTQMDFYMYSSGSSGSVSVLFQTPDGSLQKLFVTHLSYVGWKKITVPMRGKLDQNDLLLGVSLPSFLVGFVYEPDGIQTKSDVLVGFDDITAEIRDKYRLLQQTEVLIQ